MSLAGRIWKRSTDGKIEWLTMGEEHIDGALTVIEESFLINENVCRVIRIAQRQETVRQMLHLSKLIAQDGASIVAVEKATGKVVGVAFNKILKKGSDSFWERIGEEPGIDSAYAGLVDFETEVEGKVDAFMHYKAESILELTFLATHHDYYYQGIGLGLVSATINLAKTLKCIQAVIAIFSGHASQKIGRKLGWKLLAEVSYDSLIYEGKTYSDRLEPDMKSCLFMGFEI